MKTEKIYSTLPREVDNPRDLKGEKIEHEGKQYEVVDTELFMHNPPWKKGEKCGFVVKAVAVLLLSFVVLNQPVAAAVFTEFYCDASASTTNNLNAGSTTNITGILTYTSAVLAGGWDPTTGIFTVAAGNPAADGVTIGDWASVYVTAGATVATYIAQITATNATTITVSLTAKSGTAPTLDALGATTLKVGGAWKGPNAGVNFPFNFVTATQTNLNSGIAQGLPPRINLKNGTTYTVTTGLTHANAGPMRWQGMTTTPGDGGKALIDHSAAATGLVMLTASCANNDFVDLIISDTGATGGTTAGITITGAENNFVRITVHDVRTSGFNLSSTISYFVECEAYLCNKNNSGSQAGFNFGSSGAIALRCNAHDNSGSGSSGFLCSAASTLVNCISDSNGANGVTSSSTSVISLIGCDFYNNASAGVDLTAASACLSVIQNCNFVKNGTWAITSSGSPIRNGNIVNCGFGSGTQANTSGDINSNTGGINISGSVTYTANVTPWADPANGDFRINLAAAKAAGRGVFTETQASYAGTVAYPDIGAGQSQGGLGGSYTFAQ